MLDKGELRYDILESVCIYIKGRRFFRHFSTVDNCMGYRGIMPVTLMGVEAGNESTP